MYRNKAKIGKPYITSEVVGRYDVDEDTGELIERPKVVVQKEQNYVISNATKNFGKIFFGNFKKMWEMGFPIDNKMLILAEMCELMDYASYNGCMSCGQTVHIDKGVKKSWAVKYGVSEHTIKYCMKQLSEEGIIIQLGRGKYMINPYLYGKGSDSEINALRTSVDVIPQSRTQQAVVRVSIDRIRKENT